MGPVEPLIWRGGQAVSFERERGVAHVEVQPGIVHVTVRLSEHAVAAERLALLQTLAEAGVPVFLVKLHPCALSFAVRAEFAERCEQLLCEQRGASVALLRDLGLVTISAGAMRDLSGVMARIYEALVAENISVRQTGDAYDAVILLVDGANTLRAASALCGVFGLPGGEPCVREATAAQ
jgi:aspartate kinase